MRYRKKPVVVEAMQYDGDNAEDVVRWIEAEQGFVGAATSGKTLHVANLSLEPGDYVVRNREDCWACPLEVFEDSYERVRD